ncbi:hypothetical protein [Enterococcus columbae]|uniref:LXG domain-containing protein n=1 Tax=Enterococcus columbae DSM 7374 = ATCC 51263 TaxID=1121865 RepID=S0KHF3_9ENTE|nr:hypothetical protein [Enterococcus columbae]EOT38596.1 hypothetical protein OMW_02236 [Enterococcus columbae DSM 7374 = ATCC 51263]EOW87753.1 hypothetical protein I568_00039 [Enterococcus columbae DSM 7374 = ATCC 51263]
MVVRYLYPEVLIKDHPINLQAVKSNLKAMTIDKGLEAMKGNVLKKITFGLSSLVSDFKAIKNAKGLGKVIPGVNLAADLFEVGEGAMQTDDLAEKNGLKQGSAEYIASQAAGIGIDSAKVGVDAAAATVGYSVGVTAATVLGVTAGVAAAPVLVGAGAVIGGLAMSAVAVKLVSFVDDQLNLTKGAKKMAVKSIKAISNGMKSFGKTLRKVFG